MADDFEVLIVVVGTIICIPLFFAFAVIGGAIFFGRQVYLGLRDGFGDLYRNLRYGKQY